MVGNIQWRKLLLNLSAQLDCPIFFSDNSRALEKMEIYLASMKDLHLPASKFRASLEVKAFLTAMEYILDDSQCKVMI